MSTITITISTDEAPAAVQSPMPLVPVSAEKVPEPIKLTEGLPCLFHDDDEPEDWEFGIFKEYDEEDGYHPYAVWVLDFDNEEMVYEWCSYCIPYQGNEHLYTPKD